MSAQTFGLNAYAALTTQGIFSPEGRRAWDSDQQDPRDVKRPQVYSKPYPNFGKLAIADKLAFSVASLLFTYFRAPKPEQTGVCLELPGGSLSTDIGYMESVAAGFPSPGLFSATLPSSAIAEIAILYGLKGPNRVICNADSFGAAAFDCAFRLLTKGKCRAALVLYVNAFDARDRASALLPADTRYASEAYAFLMSMEPDNPLPQQTISAEFRFSSPSVSRPKASHSFLSELVQMLTDGKTGEIYFAAKDYGGSFKIERKY